ncbi:MAG: WD40 repeat domain-containing protein [Flavobacteriales bacterium]|nr:WD40 repeat domain-containing protein [Flavobacteriales bacterium]
MAVLFLPLAQADVTTRIQMRDAGVLGETDLGILGGALSPDSQTVLLYGEDGFVHLVSATSADDRGLDIDLSTGRSVDVNDVHWHPRGNTALLVGDEGLAMRYDTYDHSITNVNDSFAVIGQPLTSVTWRPSGDFAYVASENGSVWKFAEHTGFEVVENTRSSAVTDLACHRDYNICFLTTLNDGVAVIDQGHELTWLGQTGSETWVAVDCPDPLLNECTAFGSGLRSKVLEINILDASQTRAGETFAVDLLVADHTGVSSGNDLSTLIHIAPLGLLRYEPVSNTVFTVLVPSDAAAFDEVIGGRAMAAVWETDEHRGFFVTQFGNIVAFEPEVEEVEMNIMTVLVFGAVAVSVPGVILGLTYMNSPWLQRKYNDWRFGKKGD